MRVKVFAGKRKVDTFLYLPAEADSAELPSSLLSLLGELREVIEIEITAERQLARCTGQEVLQSISDSGYYLQIPPPEFAKS